MKALCTYLIATFISCSFHFAAAQTIDFKYLSKSGIKEVPRSQAYYFDVIDSLSGGAGTRTRYLIEDSTKVHYLTFSNLNGGEHQLGVLDGPYQVWHRNGILKIKGSYKANQLAGKYEEWYQNGQIKYTCHYAQNEVQDTLRGYYETGELRRVDIYDNGKIISGKVFNRDGSEAAYVEVQSMAEFPGGEAKMLQYLTRKIKYPKAMLHARQNDGIVLVSFIVSEHGEIKDLELVKSAHPEANLEAMRVINLMPRWKPASIEGEPVETRYNLPIKFTVK